MTEGTERPRQSPGQVDRTVLADTTRCPSCGKLLPGPRCTGCGIDLSGVDGARLMQVSLQAEALLAERDLVLARLRAQAAAGAQAGRPPVGAPVPLPPPAPGPAAAQPAVTLPAPRPSLMARIGVQGLLVALGALLVAVAGLVFLVFSWERLSLGGRALVIGAITAAALGGAAWLRPRLAETAEGIGAIAAVLVLADAWAVQATGLLGTDRWVESGYAAVAGAVCTAVLLGWGIAGRVRAGSVAASVIGPGAVALGGVWLTQRWDDDHGFFVAVGLLAASASALARRWAPPAWRAERTVLRLAAAGGWALAVLFVPGLLDQPGRAAAAAGLASVVAAGQVVVGRDGTRWQQAAWSSAAGAAAAAAAVAAAYRLLQLADVDRRWLLALAPAVAAASALGVNRLGGAGRPLPGLHHREATRAARVAACVLAAPAGLVAATMVLSALAASGQPWHSGPGATLIEVVPKVITDGLDVGGSVWIPVLAAGLGLAALGLLLAAARPPRWSWVAAVALASAGSTLPLVPDLPIGAVLAILLALALGAAALSVAMGPGHPLVGRTGLAVAALTGTQAVLLSWTVREFSVPVTVLGITGLVLARRVTTPRLRPALLAGAVLAAAVVVGAVAGLLGRDLQVRTQAASIAGSALAALLGTVPLRRPRLAWQERLAGVVAGVLASVAGLSWVASDLVESSTYTTGSLLVLFALLGAAAGLASRPARTGAPAGPLVPLAAAGLLAPLMLVVADGVIRRLGAGAAVEGSVIAQRSLVTQSAVLAVVGLALGLTGVRWPQDRRRPSAEIGALAMLLLLALAALAPGPTGDWESGLVEGLDRYGWVMLLLLGVGASAAAIPADRRRLGWLGWALLSLSSAYRLARSDVGVVEAYTVPPALALIAVSVYRLRRDPGRYAWNTLVPGLSLLVLPSVLASSAGSAWRPSLLIGFGALAVALSLRSGRRHERVLLAGGAAAAGGAGAVRVLRGMSQTGTPPWQEVELWALPAALVLLAIGLRLLVIHPALRSWRPLSPSLVLLLLPSFLLAFDGVLLWRVVLVAVLAGVVVAAGVLRRLQAPTVLGGVTLAAHAVAQLGPWVVRTLADQPRWLSLGLIGAILLGLGATYERRLRELRATRVQLNRLR